MSATGSRTLETAASTPTTARSRHPPGVLLVAGTEFWERFSFYGLTGLLALYLVAPVADGGLGWTQADAMQLVGLYAGSAFIAPAFGGWLASRWWGERRCIAFGGALIMLGHVVLALQAWLPTGDARAVPVLYLALALVVAGTGLLKPTISSIVGRLYPPHDPNREGGFVIFAVCIWLGSFTSSLVAGTLGEKVGWHAGFGAAAVGMAVGLVIYARNAQRYLGEIGMRPDRDGSDAAAAPGRGERANLLVLGVLSGIIVVYALCFYQYPGLLNLFVERDVDRMAGGFEIPATWYMSLITASFIVLAPVSTLVWRRLAARNVNPGVLTKNAIGLAVMGLAYVLVWGATESVATGAVAKASMAWIVVAYTMFGIADVFVWPAQMNAVTALAPARHVSTVMGLWWIATGVGILLTGYVASLSTDLGRDGLSLLLAAGCLLTAVAALALRRPLANAIDRRHPL